MEIIETEHPVMVQRFDILHDSAGAGRQRGGIGNVREYQLLVDCILTARSQIVAKALRGTMAAKDHRCRER